MRNSTEKRLPIFIMLAVISGLLTYCASPYETISRKYVRLFKKDGMTDAQLREMDSLSILRNERAAAWQKQLDSALNVSKPELLPCDTSAIVLDYRHGHTCRVRPYILASCSTDIDFHTFKVLQYSCRVDFTDTLGKPQALVYTNVRDNNVRMLSEYSPPVRVTFFNTYIQDEQGNTLKIKRIMNFKDE